MYDVLPDGRLRCYACGHCCPLPEGAIGVCKVRFNEGGRLRVPWGYVGGVQCDPIEKKPFFHAHPGRAGLQLRDARLRPALRLLPELGDVAGAARSARRSRRRSKPRPKRSCADALRQGARVIVSTYNEPLITSEWAVAVFKEAKAAGLDDRLRVERQRHAAGARIPAAVGRSLQGRSQELRRSPLPPARRPARADPRHDPPSARDGVLGRDRDAADPGLQRLARRADAAHGVRRRACRPTSRGTSRRSTATTR